ncbi:UNVERIFIED_CONTAM: uncharacterized protein DUF4062 [Acetivibrio alkalicellulosi]
MDKRYQVFVSSTYRDLQEERQEVMHALLELDCIPSGMELFPAANDDQWSLIKRVIDDSDYYILILGGRYGSIGKEGISYTEMEYRYALETNKPIISFLHKSPGDILANKTEQTTEGKEGLEEFRKLVQRKVCKYWTTPAELGSVVSRSLIQLIKHYPSKGWVKADIANNVELATEIISLRKRIKELEKEKLNVIGDNTKDSKLLNNCLSSILSPLKLGVFEGSQHGKNITSEEIIQVLNHLDIILKKYKWSEYIKANDLFFNIELNDKVKEKLILKSSVETISNLYKRIDKTLDANELEAFVFAIKLKLNSEDYDELPF